MVACLRTVLNSTECAGCVLLWIFYANLKRPFFSFRSFNLLRSDERCMLLRCHYGYHVKNSPKSFNMPIQIKWITNLIRLNVKPSIIYLTIHLHGIICSIRTKKTYNTFSQSTLHLLCYFDLYSAEKERDRNRVSSESSKHKNQYSMLFGLCFFGFSIVDPF